MILHLLISNIEGVFHKGVVNIFDWLVVVLADYLYIVSRRITILAYEIYEILCERRVDLKEIYGAVGEFLCPLEKRAGDISRGNISAGNVDGFLDFLRLHTSGEFLASLVLNDVLQHLLGLALVLRLEEFRVFLNGLG